MSNARDPTPLSCLCLPVGDSGLFVCRLENSALATEKESRLLLYQDMDSDLDNLSCSERLAKAQFASKDQRSLVQSATTTSADAM